MGKIITLTSDFGQSEYAGIIKGVILSHCPDVQIVDITHNIEPFNIRHCMWVLSASVPYFPEDAIHVAVVDPGVGTERKGVIIKKDDSYFIGPDNGIFSFLQDPAEIYEISLQAKSNTFHGRDIFAVSGGKIASGISPNEIGKKTDSFLRLDIPGVTINKHNVKGEVAYIDSFGNVVTNINKEHLEEANIKYGDKIRIKSVNKNWNSRILRTYGESNPGELIALFGSSGYLEVAVNMGNSRQKMGISSGDLIEVFLCADC